MSEGTDEKKEIEEIHGKITRNEAMRSFLGTEDQRVKAIQEVVGTDLVSAAHIAEFLLPGINPSRVARSEVVASEEEVADLTGKVNLVRDWLLQQGETPEGEVAEQIDPKGKVLINGKYWLGAEPEGEIEVGQFIRPVKLFVEEDDFEGNVNTRIEVGFDNRYRLEIIYFRTPNEGQKPSSAYSSKTRPLNEMAKNEAVIVNGVLEDLIKNKIQPEATENSPADNS